MNLRKASLTMMMIGAAGCTTAYVEMPLADGRTARTVFGRWMTETSVTVHHPQTGETLMEYTSDPDSQMIRGAFQMGMQAARQAAVGGLLPAGPVALPTLPDTVPNSPGGEE